MLTSFLQRWGSALCVTAKCKKEVFRYEEKGKKAADQTKQDHQDRHIIDPDCGHGRSDRGC